MAATVMNESVFSQAGGHGPSERLPVGRFQTFGREIRDEQTIRDEPSGGGGQRGEFVSDVVQAVDARHQIEVFLNFPFRERPDVKRYIFNGFRNRVESIHQIDAENPEPLRRDARRQAGRALHECATRSAAEIEPGDRRTVGEPVKQKIRRVEAQFAFVTVASRAVASAVHQRIGDDPRAMEFIREKKSRR